MYTRHLSSSKVGLFLILSLAMAQPAMTQGIVLESTPQAETMGAFDGDTIRFTNNATEESLFVTPRPRTQERPILLVPELHLDLGLQRPEPKPPLLLAPQE